MFLSVVNETPRRENQRRFEIRVSKGTMQLILIDQVISRPLCVRRINILENKTIEKHCACSVIIEKRCLALIALRYIY